MKQNVATSTKVTVFGGNFCGACHGLDQAISFIKNAYPKKKHMITLGFNLVIKRNTRKRFKTCRNNLAKAKNFSNI